MKLSSKLYYFLGSVYLAIILIAVTALFVIAGTFIVSDIPQQASSYQLDANPMLNFSLIEDLVSQTWLFR